MSKDDKVVGFHRARHHGRPAWRPICRRPGFKLVVTICGAQAASASSQCRRALGASPRGLPSQADIVFTSLPGRPKWRRSRSGRNGLLAGMQARYRLLRSLDQFADPWSGKLHAPSPKGAHMLDAPVSGGPRARNAAGSRSGSAATRASSMQHKPVLDAMGDQAALCRPDRQRDRGEARAQYAGYAMECALAEVFTMGVKAGIDPLPLFEAVRQGAGRPPPHLRCAGRSVPAGRL